MLSKRVSRIVFSFFYRTRVLLRVGVWPAILYSIQRVRSIIDELVCGQNIEDTIAYVTITDLK